MPMQGPVYAFIMAGGIGSRLWPRSRTATPKQFLDLVGEQTMLQESYYRLTPIIPGDQILVGVGAQYVPTVRAQLPELPPENIVVEPSGRGTAPAIGLGALHIHRRDPEAAMVVVTADHHIGDVARFQRALIAAVEMARRGHLVTLGIQPTFASSGYGYIRRAERLDTIDGFDIYRAIRFTEKPNAQMAQAFVDSGLYSWNSGMFVWRTAAIRDEFARQMPRLASQLAAIERAMGTRDEERVLAKAWATVRKETIDYGVMEHAEDVAVIPVHIAWNDIGSWQTLMELLPPTDGHGNVLLGDHVTLDTHRTLIYSPAKVVATVGIEDLIVVETEDALLICPRQRSQQVRDLVEALRSAGRVDLL
ncbi:MAG: mannose-1-phosphate guanylyltransferase [Anaerolineae bacterium]|nr:mannose-1-phosphate guanylyltransferase [Anaerolineae bacterium]